jgi:septum formation protein
VVRPVLLLASSSPRRRDLLTRAGIAFALVEPGPEPEAHGPPLRRAVLRARSKAMGATPGAGSLLPVLGVDTVVDVEGVEHGKAADRDEAERLLRALFGRSHQVHTAHSLIAPQSGAMRECVTTSVVSCTTPSEADLQAYLDSGDWQGKAGAYGIQDAGAHFLRVQQGPLDSVIGLHVDAVRQLLRELLG